MSYLCATCGLTADSPGHLCSPCDTALGRAFCGKPDASAGHICQEHPQTMHFVCAACGCVAEERHHLCNPEPHDD